MFAKFRMKLIFLGFAFLAFPFFAQATVLDFNIDPSYDYLGRSQVSAFLHQLGNKAYFFVEEDYYQTLDMEERTEFTQSLKELSEEFDRVIYPQLTNIYGSEWKPGIDQDEKITVLLTQIKDDSAGYFNSGDEYPKSQVLTSNEREMVYLNVNYVNSGLIESYLAHELTHLITFNQKERIFGLSEEIWLNEARAEVAPTLLGYDDEYTGSNLQKRVKSFSQKPTDPLTEWKNLSADYGAVNLFMQYLVDHYGVEVLTKSFQSNKIGIPSLNEALEKTGFSEDFSQVFTDWLITVLINDCQVSPKYCYSNPNLKNLKILPQFNYLPLADESTLQVTDYTKDWSGNWFKLIGGQGMLKIEFIGEEKIEFEMPYALQDSSGQYSVNYLELDSFQRGVIYIPGFGEKYDSLTLIPSAQSKISGFDGLESFHKFIWLASIINEDSEKEEEEEQLLIEKLLVQIEFLKEEIAKTQAKIAAILAERQGGSTCQNFGSDLYYGMVNNAEVSCLQQFLRDLGAEIYPEGLVTGNFLGLTETAVIRFQEKYASEILSPLGLEKGTGYFGSLTRQKANQLIHK